MNVTIKPEQQTFVLKQVKDGQYSSADEVVEEALRLLEEHAKLRYLQAAIAVAEEEFARGEGIEWTSESMEHLVNESRERAARGESINSKPDVLP